MATSRWSTRTTGPAGAAGCICGAAGTAIWNCAPGPRPGGIWTWTGCPLGAVNWTIVPGGAPSGTWTVMFVVAGMTCAMADSRLWAVASLRSLEISVKIPRESH